MVKSGVKNGHIDQRTVEILCHSDIFDLLVYIFESLQFNHSKKHISFISSPEPKAHR